MQGRRDLPGPFDSTAGLRCCWWCGEPLGEGSVRRRYCPRPRLCRDKAYRDRRRARRAVPERGPWPGPDTASRNSWRHCAKSCSRRSGRKTPGTASSRWPPRASNAAPRTWSASASSRNAQPTPPGRPSVNRSASRRTRPARGGPAGNSPPPRKKTPGRATGARTVGRDACAGACARSWEKPPAAAPAAHLTGRVRGPPAPGRVGESRGGGGSMHGRAATRMPRRGRRRRDHARQPPWMTSRPTTSLRAGRPAGVRTPADPPGEGPRPGRGAVAEIFGARRTQTRRLAVRRAAQRGLPASPGRSRTLRVCTVSGAGGPLRGRSLPVPAVRLPVCPCGVTSRRPSGPRSRWARAAGSKSSPAPAADQG